MISANIDRPLSWIFLTAALSLAGPAQAEISTIREAVDGFIRPAYAAFARATLAETETVARLCASPSQEALEASRTAFVGAVTAWATVETVRLGPVTKDNRLERILYWPDRKSIGLKQVQATIAQEDPSAADPSRLASKSVALQGLGALEFILFGSGAEDLISGAKPYRCQFGAAIAANLENIATDVEAEWKAPGGFADLWINPGPDNAQYRTEIEAANDFIETFVTGLELVRDVRINGFVGDERSGDKPRQAIFWRSGADYSIPGRQS
jgi:predicted lipoprotein